jgi:hypothetical protein
MIEKQEPRAICDGQSVSILDVSPQDVVLSHGDTFTTSLTVEVEGTTGVSWRIRDRSGNIRKIPHAHFGPTPIDEVTSCVANRIATDWEAFVVQLSCVHHELQGGDEVDFIVALSASPCVGFFTEWRFTAPREPL